MDQSNTEYNIIFRKYKSISYQGMKYTSGSIVYTKLPPQPIANNSQELQSRPVVIDYFVLHALENVQQHLFAVVSWLKEHPDKDHFSKPLEIWWKDLIEYNLNVFVPVQLLICHSIHCDIIYEEQNVCLMCPVKNI